jgi:hypothetical protein
VALLFPATGSVVVEVADGVFVRVVGVPGAVTVIVTVIVLRLVIAPRVHVTVLVPEHEPCVVEEETNVVPAGSTSVRVPFAVSTSPRFWTWIVYVRVENTKTGVGDAPTDTAKSACPAVSTNTDVVEASFDATGSAVVDVVSAELRMIVPAATAAPTVTLTVKLAVEPFVKFPPPPVKEQRTCPVAPTAGVLQVQFTGDVMDWNVVLGGVCW